MAETGFPVELALASSVLDWKTKEHIEESSIFQEYTKGLKRTLQIFKALGKSDDIELLIYTESSLVELEKLHFKKDPSVKASLDAASIDFSVMKKGLSLVRSPDYYQKVDDAYHSKRKIGGVPVDGFHDAINAHIARLGNRIRTVGLSVPEKNILMARLENMRTAKELYIQLQRKALGLKEPEKSVSKGMEL